VTRSFVRSVKNFVVVRYPFREKTGCHAHGRAEKVLLVGKSKTEKDAIGNRGAKTFTKDVAVIEA